jgi:hypothetical protein
MENQHGGGNGRVTAQRNTPTSFFFVRTLAEGLFGGFEAMIRRLQDIFDWNAIAQKL